MAKSDLFDAIRKNSLRQLLLESGCEVDCRNANSETPLMVSLYGLRNKEQRERTIKQLLQAGADVNARNAQGHTPLSFACALDQADSIRLLLQQDDVDVNLGDISGVTPLMTSAALGHRAAVNALLEFPGGGEVYLNLQAKDDSDFTATDYAAVSGNGSLAEHIKGRSSKAGKLNNNRTMNNMKSKAGPKGKVPSKADQEIEMVSITPAALRDSNLPAIQQFGRDVQALQAQTDTNLVALKSSRPSSRSSSSASTKHRPNSEDRSASRAGSRASRQSKERPASRVSTRSKGSLTVPDDDDALDLDLSSLRDLMGTVREAAKEIREIVEPLQKEKEQAERSREQKRRHRKSNSHNSGRRQQIQAEVHVISEINNHAIPRLTPTAPMEENQPPPKTYLHVENEEMAHTWPRQKGHSVSRERSLSGSSGMGNFSSEGSSSFPTPKYGPGPEPPRVFPNAAKTEQQILEKVVGRRHGGLDPLVAAINNTNTTPKSRLIMESRQRIVGRAREHWSTHQISSSQSQPTPLPHITVSEHRKYAAEEELTQPAQHEEEEQSSPEDNAQQDEAGPESASKAQSTPQSEKTAVETIHSFPENVPLENAPLPKPPAKNGPAPKMGIKNGPTGRYGQTGGTKQAIGNKSGSHTSPVRSDDPSGPDAKPESQSKSVYRPPAEGGTENKQKTKQAPGKAAASGPKATGPGGGAKVGLRRAAP